MFNVLGGKIAQGFKANQRTLSTLAAQATKSNQSLVTHGVVGGLYAAGAYTTYQVFASGDEAHPPAYNWNHEGWTQSYDHGAMRRGYEVYRQVCSTCHSMDLVCFRNLVGETHTEEQAKALAASYEIRDGPNDEGEMFERPGKLSDHFPAPYANEETARFINAGALPPDLSCVSKARHNGVNYIFSLLTGYKEAPAGLELRDGLHYNPYFPGGAIGMAPPLNAGQVEYEDGTVASVPQMAKDVAIFLTWCSSPEHDERKKMGCKAVFTFGLAALTAGYYKRFKWSMLKTRRISYIN